MKAYIRMLAVVVGAQLCLLAGTTARADEADIALLTSYVGDWRGDGVLVGGDKPEPFRCRLSIAKGNPGKINYSGRCSLVDANLSVSGTIAYSEQFKRFEAAMSSNAGFTGMAVGVESGDQITFDLKEQQKDRGGSDVRIGAAILLIAGTIQVDFEVEFNNSGDVLRAAVPFAR